MNKFVDLTGQVFGERVVTGFSHQHKTSRNIYWNTLCLTCSYEAPVKGTSLRGGIGCRSCAARANGRKGLYSQAKGKLVYFIGCGEYFKIGCSDNIDRRLKDMQVNNPYEVTLLGVDEDEEFWHRVFAHRHHHGEWYSRL